MITKKTIRTGFPSRRLEWTGCDRSVGQEKSADAEEIV